MHQRTTAKVGNRIPYHSEGSSASQPNRPMGERGVDLRHLNIILAMKLKDSLVHESFLLKAPTWGRDGCEGGRGGGNKPFLALFEVERGRQSSRG